jgi:hypothetical protein
MKKILLAILCLLAHIAASGCAKNSAEDVFAADLRATWLKFAKMPATEALETNDRLLTRALVLESTNNFGKLSPDGVIGNLELREYVLCQILDQGAEAARHRKLAFQRLVGAKIIPETYTEDQKGELFEKIVKDFRAVEAYSWSQPRPRGTHEGAADPKTPGLDH